MQAQIQRSTNNTLVIALPEGIANQIALTEGMNVEIQIIEGKLVITPTFPQYHLDDLLSAITPDNLHSEIDTGNAAGNEIG